MTLDEYIEALEAMPRNVEVWWDTGGCPGEIDSWRGRYNEATLTQGSAKSPSLVQDLIEDAKKARNGKVYQGYKGGDYTYSAHTPLWADDYGSCAYRIPTKIVQWPNETIVRIETFHIGEYV